MENILELTKELENKRTNQLDDVWDLKSFKGKRIITFGTFDLFHIGHKKIIDHAIEISGTEEKVIIAVSSDRWNKLKGKKSHESQEERVNKIKTKYSKATIILEDHCKAEDSWPEIWDTHNVDLILMGGDHFENLSYINDIFSPNGKRMKISFFERTPKISSSLIREGIKSS